MSQIDVVVLGALDENVGDLTNETLKVKASLLYGDKILVKSHKIPFLLGRIAAYSRQLAQHSLETGVFDKEMAQQVALSLEERGLVGDDRNSKFLLDTLRGENPSQILLLPEALAVEMRERIKADGNAHAAASFLRSTVHIAVENYLRRKCSGPELKQMLEAADELVMLSDSGFVEVDTAGSESVASSEFEEIETAFSESIQRALDTFAADRSEHPLFTAGARLHIRDGSNRASLPETSLTNANRAELAASLIADIPSFLTASVDELIDIRSRLEPHLSRFRAAIASLEEELGASVFDEDFSRAIEDLKLRHVHPAMEELHESLNENGLGASAARATPSLATGVLGLGASLAIGAPDLAGVAAVSAGATTAAAKEVLERRKFEGERKKHRMFLLFDTQRQLEP